MSGQNNNTYSVIYQNFYLLIYDIIIACISKNRPILGTILCVIALPNVSVYLCCHVVLATAFPHTVLCVLAMECVLYLNACCHYPPYKPPHLKKQNARLQVCM